MEWPLQGLGARTQQATTSFSTGVTVTAGAANTMGSWTQIIASTPRNAIGVMVWVRPSTTLIRYLIDIGVGAGGSEALLIPSLHVSNILGMQQYFFPIGVPATSRISARCQSATAAATCVVAVGLVYAGTPDAPSPLVKAAPWGAAAATSGGTSIDPGAVANTKGAFVNLASLGIVRQARWMNLSFGIRNNAAIGVATHWLVDVASDSAGSGLILENIPLTAAVTGNLQPAAQGPFPINIPLASGIFVRAQCSNTDATDRLVDIVVHTIS